MADQARAGVVGYPVEHSLSPDIFRVLSQRTRIGVDYTKIPIRPEAFSKSLRDAARTNSFTGWNVTIPHKEKAARHVDELEVSARAVGAVNVIRFKCKKATGYNTDVLGIRETFRRAEFRTRKKTAVVFGAGGAAAAVAFALGQERAAQVWIVNRTRSKARSLCRKMGILFPKTRFEPVETAPGNAEIYINSTPLGMKGFPRSPKLPRFQKTGVLVFDLIYRPARTPFLASAEKQGACTINGLDMLVAQAIATWEIWFGKLSSSLQRADLHDAVYRSIAAKLRRAS